MEVIPPIGNKRGKNDYGNLLLQAKKGQHHWKGEKYKPRICAHGGMYEKGINYWETYAPVVQWMSVRIMLILSAIKNLHTKSIDFLPEYPQAELDVDIYM